MYPVHETKPCVIWNKVCMISADLIPQGDASTPKQICNWNRVVEVLATQDKKHNPFLQKW